MIGWLIEYTQRLTNTRYADDVMLFGKSAEEIIHMTELLIEELPKVGLHSNGTKTKILTSDPPEYAFLDIGGDMGEIIGNSCTHKYLGRNLPGDLAQRGRIEITYRIQVAWFKFRKHTRVFTNKQISVKLRLKLFDIVITPSILCGLSTLPVHQAPLDKINGTQLKMLREIVGWVRYPTETWEATMRRMKHRVARALIQYPISDWSKRIHGMKAKMVRRIEN